MVAGLPVDRVVRVDLQLAQLAAQPGNFGIAMALGSSTVIDVAERFREYSDIDGVAADFGTNTAEYRYAVKHFSQVPRPRTLFIGRWAKDATAGVLRGAILDPSQRALANFTAITAGALKLTIDGTSRQVTGLDFSGATNINGVAAIVQAALVALVAGTAVVYDGVANRFVVSSPSTGTSSTFGFPVAPSTGTDIAATFGLVSAAGAVVVPGKVAETLLQAALALADVSSDWYGLALALDVPPAVADQVAVAEYIEASDRARLFASTIVSTVALDGTNASDLGSVAKSRGFRRTVTQYSSSSSVAVASYLARAFTVNFRANRSTITMKFKAQPGVDAEYLTASEATALKTKNINVLAAYRNGTSIVQEGVVANGTFFDEVHGLDWLISQIQTNIWNLLRGSTTKIPQTNQGSALIAAAIAAACDDGVNNGLIAPGQWNADGFGELESGKMLTSGWYIFYPPVETQEQSDREARHSVPFQLAVKLAGAVHDVDVILNVNR